MSVTRTPAGSSSGLDDNKQRDEGPDTASGWTDAKQDTCGAGDANTDCSPRVSALTQPRLYEKWPERPLERSFFTTAKAFRGHRANTFLEPTDDVPSTFLRGTSRGKASSQAPLRLFPQWAQTFAPAAGSEDSHVKTEPENEIQIKQESVDSGQSTQVRRQRMQPESPHVQNAAPARAIAAIPPRIGPIQVLPNGVSAEDIGRSLRAFAEGHSGDEPRVTLVKVDGWWTVYSDYTRTARRLADSTHRPDASNWWIPDMDSAIREIVTSHFEEARRLTRRIYKTVSYLFQDREYCQDEGIARRTLRLLIIVLSNTMLSRATMPDIIDCSDLISEYNTPGILIDNTEWYKKGNIDPQALRPYSQYDAVLESVYLNWPPEHSHGGPISARGHLSSSPHLI